MRKNTFISAIFVLLLFGNLAGQEVDTLIQMVDTVRSSIDSLLFNKASQQEPEIKMDSVLSQNQDRRSVNPPRADNTEEGSGVIYGSQDSNWMDTKTMIVHLHGNAYVRFEDFEVTADYIMYDFNKQEIEAYAFPKSQDKPHFKTAEQSVTADKIRFNVKTQKGIVEGARVQQGELFIHGAITKFVKAGSDSLHIDDVIYNRNALVTTCDRAHPHWGIRTTKLKLIPDKLAVIGPFNMELAGIPMPLVMPFAFAPLFNFNQGTSGLIFPRDPFYQSPNLGIGIRGLGYYMKFSEYMDLGLTGDIYTRGSWGLTANSNYAKRYKHRGSLNLSFSRQLSEVQGQLDPNIQNSYSVTINHNQDAKAHPFRRIGGSLRFTVNDFDRRNFTDAESQINSQINSNFSYSYKLSNVLTFSSGISHSQNTLNRSISFTVPTMQLRLNRIFPFKSAGSSSREKWFEKISLQYNGQFMNSVNTVDTLLFSSETLDLFRAGMTHELTSGASYNLLGNLNFNTSVDYDEIWYFQTFEATSDTSGRVINDFRPYRDFSLSGGLTTNLFGTVLFKKGLIRGLRHEMTPTIGMSLSPSTENNYQFLDADPDDPLNEEVRYNPFSPQYGERLFRSTRLDVGGASVTYGLRNRLRGKYWSKRDSTAKNFEILSADFSGSYNLNADSLNWSELRFSATSRLFSGITTISLGGSFDPYALGANGQRVNRTLWSESRKLLRLVGLTGSLSSTLTLKQIRDLIKGESPTGRSGSSRSSRSTGSQQSTKTEYPELFSWFQNFRIQHTYRFSIRTISGVKEFETSAHTLRLTTGQIPVSDKWAVGIGNITYDFKRKQFVYPSFNISRNLHCWQMRASWQPASDSYTFSIGVVASPFNQYLKYETGRTQFDSTFR